MGLAEVETSVAEKPVVGKKLKLKFCATKPLISACEVSKNVHMGDCIKMAASTDTERTASAANKKLICPNRGTKRRLEGPVEYQNNKKFKMGRQLTLYCKSILSKLMKQRNSNVFNKPVDPVTLGIPDYFEFIKNPMDLGTIKQKLDRNLYCDAEEFAYDVRLTFSNAMKYNPPKNLVHQLAKQMMSSFNNDWKMQRVKVGGQCEARKPSLEKSNKEVQQREAASVKDGMAKDSKWLKTCRPDPDLCGPPRPCTEKACKKVQNLRPPQSVAVVKGEEVSAPCNKGQHDELKAVEVNNTSTSILSQSDPGSNGAVSCLDEEHACASSVKTSSVGSTTEGLETLLDIELSPSKALRAAMLKSRFADTILKAQHKTLLQPGGKTDTVKLQQEKERLERRQREEKLRIEAQIRAAESAARSKAESELKKQQDQERLAESELKKQRDQERLAARIALEKMERSIDLDDNFHILRELESLVGTSLFVLCQRDDSRSRVMVNQFQNGKLGSPLERLGLFIKAEYMVGDGDEDLLIEDWEEGEVVF